MIIWVVTPRSLIGVHQYSSEMLVDVYCVKTQKIVLFIVTAVRASMTQELSKICRKASKTNNLVSVKHCPQVIERDKFCLVVKQG
jgi:hypothetical protein